MSARCRHRRRRRGWINGCPGFGRRWLAAMLECGVCGAVAVHVMPCKHWFHGDPPYPCHRCRCVALHATDEAEPA